MILTFFFSRIFFIFNFVVFVLVRYLWMKNKVEVKECRSETGKLLAKTWKVCFFVGVNLKQKWFFSVTEQKELKFSHCNNKQGFRAKTIVFLGCFNFGLLWKLKLFVLFSVHSEVHLKNQGFLLLFRLSIFKMVHVGSPVAEPLSGGIVCFFSLQKCLIYTSCCLSFYCLCSSFSFCLRI